MADDRVRISRRKILQTAGAAAVLGAVGRAGRAQERDQPGAAGITRAGPGQAQVSFTLNGKKASILVEPRVTLLDALRDRLGLTGAKRICDRGACGGCTVWVDGKTVNACMMLALDAEGREVTTIEGLSKGADLHPIQEAFIKHDALQCGFCTPGMIMTCAAFVDGVKKPTDGQIRDAVAGNLCRCGTYPNIFSACKEAAR